jgi:phosphosulfolactate phosphohydrolase-like enzyme
LDVVVLVVGLERERDECHVVEAGQNLNEAAEDMYSADMFKQLCSSMTKLSLTEECVGWCGSGGGVREREMNDMWWRAGQNLNEAAEDMYSADMFKQLCTSITKLRLTESELDGEGVSWMMCVVCDGNGEWRRRRRGRDIT